MIELNQVKKIFNDKVVALNQISTRIEQGEFVVVLGPSGSGKTTLLRTINGLVPLSEGTIRINGIDVIPGNYKEVRCNVGMIFQQFNLVGNLSVINNVLTGCLAAHRNWYSGLYYFPKKTRLKALEIIDRVGLLDQAYQRADTLSGGQQQRVGIARALMQNPKILLADEPIASLDPLISHNILSLLKKICLEDKLTVLCSLHQVDFALQFAQRILGLSDGKKVLDEKADGMTVEYIENIYGSHDQGMFYGLQKEIGSDESLITWGEYT